VHSAGKPSIQFILAYLADRLNAYLDELVLVAWDQFDIRVSKQCITRLLFTHRWSRKVCKRRALEARSDLRAAYMTTASRYNMANLVFLDESASNERNGCRKR
jgi:hypothetical protein